MLESCLLDSSLLYSETIDLVLSICFVIFSIELLLYSILVPLISDWLVYSLRSNDSSSKSFSFIVPLQFDLRFTIRFFLFSRAIRKSLFSLRTTNTTLNSNFWPSSRNIIMTCNESSRVSTLYSIVLKNECKSKSKLIYDLMKCIMVL